MTATTMMGTAPAEQVWYVELKGADALDRLDEWLDELPGQPGFLGAELLDSPQQPGLALIASRWQTTPPALDVPAGAKHWVFRVRAQR